MSKTRKSDAVREMVKSDSRRDSLGVINMFLVAGGLLLAYHFFAVSESAEPVSHSGAARGIVVVDSKAVLQGFMDVMQERIADGQEFTEGQLNMSGQDFAVEYMRAVKKYRDAGFLVIDKQYALGVPEASEITLEIGEALGLNVTPTADPFAAPALK